MARVMRSPVQAVVLGFEEPEFDERPFARMTARRCGADLHEYVLRPNALAALPEIVWQYGQPMADVSIVPTYYVAKAIQRHVTVALNGDGADELFAGYARPGALCEVEAFRYGRAFGDFREDAYTSAFRQEIGKWRADNLFSAARIDTGASDEVDRVLHLDFSTYLPDQLLKTVLESQSFRDQGWLCPHWIRQALDQHVSGRRDWTEQLWTAFILEIWARVGLDGSLRRTGSLSPH